MKYSEEIRDLFSVDRNKYALAHCISADFALGAGIATQFNNLFRLRPTLNNQFYNYSSNYFLNNHNGYCIYIPECKVFNLITKAYYYKKPTYKTLENALRDMKKLALYNNIHAIAMPLIGCGLDKLQWTLVRCIIQKVFNDTDMEILICRQ